VNAGAKLAGFGLVLAAFFGAGAALGSVVGPIDVGNDAPRTPGHTMPRMNDDVPDTPGGR
jgi:hypothetical protein